MARITNLHTSDMYRVVVEMLVSQHDQSHVAHPPPSRHSQNQ
jgi:hypothetical protein